MGLLLFGIISFVIIYLMSYIIVVRKSDKNKRIPVEVSYLVKRYNIDLKDINYKKFLNQVSIVGSIDMTIALIIIFPIKSFIIQILIGFLILVPLILISYKIYAKYLIKKGYVKNGNKKNRK